MKIEKQCKNELEPLVTLMFGRKRTEEEPTKMPRSLQLARSEKTQANEESISRTQKY